MPTVHLPYVDSAIDHMDRGGPTALWRNLHWGLYDSPDVDDDSPEGYVRAAAALTERVVTAAAVVDRGRVVDVGCGFGGTLAHLRERHPACRPAGVNIDVRQLRWARRLLDDGPGQHPPSCLVAADGGRLPVPDRSVDHVLAVECVFHFPSRKEFFREAARVLRPGGTLAITDFLLSPGGLARFVAKSRELASSDWYGHSAAPITPAAYAAAGQGHGVRSAGRRRRDRPDAAHLPRPPPALPRGRCHGRRGHHRPGRGARARRRLPLPRHRLAPRGVRVHE